jgi:Lon protease-like protein
VLLPLFPLDLVLFPKVPLPLHIFEERYKEMIGRCISDGKPFGVALVTDGRSVGGRAETAAVGTTAEILQHRLQPDGRYLVVTRGVQRFRILDRPEDAPYPRAEVALIDEDVPTERDVDAAGALVPQVRRYLALAAEAGELDLVEGVQLADDPLTASYEAASIVKVPDLRRQELLEATLPDRLAAVTAIVAAENARLVDVILTR